MKRHALNLAACILVFACLAVRAQDQPQPPGPEKQHQWLKQFVGQWESKSEATMGPGQPAMQSQGTMSSRMLGKFWLVSDLVGDMEGTSIKAIQTIGYDPAKKKYVGVWIDSHMNYMWQSEGTIDESGKKLTLEAEGPNYMAGGKMTKFRDAFEFKTANHIVHTSQMLGEDGKWVAFMTGDMRRTK